MRSFVTAQICSLLACFLCVMKSNFKVCTVIPFMYFQQLVFETLLAAAKGLHDLSNPEEEFVLDVALIHLTYSSVQARLSCFAELVRTFPTVVQEVIQYRRQLRVNEMVSLVPEHSAKSKKCNSVVEQVKNCAIEEAC